MKYIVSVHLHPSGGSSACLELSDGMEITIKTKRLYPEKQSIDVEYCLLMAEVDKYMKTINNNK